MTPKMLDLLTAMTDGKRRLHGRGRTMSALEVRGYVRRHLPHDAKFACRFTITDAGREALKAGPFAGCRDDWQSPGKTGPRTKQRAADMRRPPFATALTAQRRQRP